jgi:geranylgeranyl diphosphate synthase, type II
MEHMKNIQFYSQKFEDALNNESFISDPLKLYEPIQYTLSIGGKRLRPVLCLMGCELFGGDCSKSMPAAIAMEIFHNFTLVHDDIMDNSPIRRGMPTVFKKWNTNIAILSGDVMFAKAYEYVAKLESENLRKVLNVFTDTAIKVCEGQQYDMDYESISNVSIVDYLHMIQLKTAVLIGASLKIGALIADASEDETNALYDFGLNMGIVFQLQDDLLDMYSDEEKFGKKIGSDVLAGKKTYLFLKTLELLSPGDKEEFYVYYTDKDNCDEEKIQNIKNVYNTYDIRKHTIELMNHYHKKSLETLDKCKGDKEVIELLKQLAESMLMREL